MDYCSVACFCYAIDALAKQTKTKKQTIGFREALILKRFFVFGSNKYYRFVCERERSGTAGRLVQGNKG